MATAELRTIALSEVDEHNTAQSLWMIIDKKVYDVTKFLGQHPGGDAVLLEQGGQDASEPFEDAGHSDDARAMLKDYLIGELRKEDWDAKPTPKVPEISEPGTSWPLDGYQFSWPHLLIPIGVVLAASLILRYYWTASAVRKV